MCASGFNPTATPSPGFDGRLSAFISSTFLDLQAERDLLNNRTLPTVALYLSKRNLLFTWIELRWGVLEREVAEGRLLHACFDRIDVASPFFICIIGSRYGTRLRSIPAELLTSHPWLRGCEGRSVTELEVRYALQRADARRLLFYERTREPGARDRADEHDLDLLRRRIREAGHDLHPFRDAPELGARLEADLLHASEIFAAEARDALRPVFLTRRLAAHLDRPRVIERLFDELERGRPVVLTGSEGSGKSAVLASMATQLRETYPVVAEHWVTANAGHGGWRACVSSILRALDQPAPSTTDPSAWRAAVSRALASHDGSACLVLDGLDQLERRDGAEHLAWLPVGVDLPAAVVISARPGPVVVEAKRRGWAIVEMPPLSADEGREIARRRLLAFGGKALEPEAISTVLQSPLSGNPLWLQAMLSELMRANSRDELRETFNALLAPSTLRDFYQALVERLERTINSRVVRRALGFLAAARVGVAEPDLLILLSNEERSGAGYDWIVLRAALGDHLDESPGRVRIAQTTLLEVVRERYLSDPVIHRRLLLEYADLLDRQAIGPTRLDEQPWLLEQAGDAGRLQGLLSDPDFLAAAWAHDEVDANERYAALRRLGGDIVAAASRAGERDDALQAAVQLLSATTEVRAARQAVRSLALRARSADETVMRVTCASSLGRLEHIAGRVDRAVRLHRFAAKRFEELGRDHERVVALGELAAALQTVGRFAECEQVALTTLELARRRHDEESVPALLNQLTTVCILTERFDEVRRWSADAMAAARSVGSIEEFERARSLRAAADFEEGRAQGDPVRMLASPASEEPQGFEADPITTLEAKLASDERRGDLVGMGVTLGSLAVIYRDKGRLDDALCTARRAVDILRAAGVREPLGQALNNLGTVLVETDRVSEALALFVEQGEVYLGSAAYADLDTCLANQGAAHLKLDEYTLAARRFRQARHVAEQLGRKRSAATSEVQLAMASLKARWPWRSLVYSRAARRRFEALNRTSGKLSSIRVGAQALAHLHRHDEARREARYALHLARETGSQRELALAVAVLTEVLLAAGRGGLALHARTAELRCWTAIGDDSSVATASGELVKEAFQLERYDIAAEAVTAHARAWARLGQRDAVREEVVTSLEKIKSELPSNPALAPYVHALERLAAELA